MNELKKLTFPQVMIYLIGIIVLAAGITLNTKSGLGVSSIISVAYVISLKTGILFATMSFVYYCFLIFLQILLLKKEFSPFQFLQIGASLFTSFFIGIYDKYIPDAKPGLNQYIVLLLAIFLTSLGVTMTVNMKIVPNPADGLTAAISKVLNKDLGFAKNLLDFTCLALSTIMSLVFLGKLQGIGIGTVVSMVLTGRFIAAQKGLGKKLIQIAFK